MNWDSSCLVMMVVTIIINAIISRIFYKIYKSRCIYDVSCHHHTRKTFLCKITPWQHMLFVLNQKISFIIQLLWHQLNQKINFFYVKWWQWYQKRSMYCFEISLYVPVALHKWYLYNLYRRPINLFRTIEVWYYVCLCALTGEILIALVCQIFASCVTSKARKFCCSSSCNMTVSSFQI